MACIFGGVGHINFVTSTALRQLLENESHELFNILTVHRNFVDIGLYKYLTKTLRHFAKFKRTKGSSSLVFVVCFHLV